MHPLCYRNCLRNSVRIHPINLLNMPAKRFKPQRHIFGKSKRSRAINGNTVVIVKVNEFPYSKMSRQRSRLTGNPFHQVTIRNNGVGEMVHKIEPRAIVNRGQVPLCHRKTHTMSKTLTKRSGRHFYPSGNGVLWMPRSPAVRLPKLLQIINR